MIGSYSSFLALLLVATLLAFRNIFDYGLGLLRDGESPMVVMVTVYLLLGLCDLLFIVVPGVPMVISIRRAFRNGNRALGITLSFIGLVYLFAITAQFVYMAIEKEVPF